MGDEPGAPGIAPDDPTPVEGLPSAEQTLARLDNLADKLGRLAATAGASDSEERISKVEAAVKWASPWRQLIGFVTFLVVGGIAVYSALRSYAREAVIETVKEAHADEKAPVEPSVQTVEKLKEDVGSVKTGVDALVQEKETRKQIKEVEIELELHRQQHQELVQEWSAKKAAGRRAGTKPQKNPRHIQLEADLKKLASEG